MAYLLIRDRDRVCGDPIKDARNTKRGHVIAVYEDDEPGIQIPCPEPWVWVKINGVTKAQVEKYLAPHYDMTDPDRPVLVHRRLYKLRWADLPVSVRNALRDNRYYETSWTAIRNYIQNQATGVNE